MQRLVSAYVEECKREHVQPYSGFIQHVASCAVDADLSDVPVPTIDLFARAMNRLGAPASRAAASKPSSAQRSSGHSKGDAALTSSSPARLVALCLHHTTHAQDRHGRRTQPPPGRLTAGAAVQQARAEERDITAFSQRAVLKRLVDGVRTVTIASRDCLHTLVLAGLPLDTVPQSAMSLMRALPTCTNLRVLSLNGCSLGSAGGRTSRQGQALFTVLTSSPSSGLLGGGFPHLEVASFADCGLTDAEGARGVRSLLAIRHDGVARDAWQQSLRSAPPTPPQATASASASSPASAALPREEEGHHAGAGGVRHLDLSGNALSTLTLRALQHGLLDDKSLLTLDLSRNRCSTPSIAALLHSGVLERCQLQSIDLSDNEASSGTTVTTTTTTIAGAAPDCPARVSALFACVCTPAQRQLLYLRRTSHNLPRASPSPSSPSIASPAPQSVMSSSARAVTVPITTVPTALKDSAAAPAAQTWSGPGTALPLPHTRSASNWSHGSHSHGSHSHGSHSHHSRAHLGTHRPTTSAGLADVFESPSSVVSSSHLQATSKTMIQISPSTSVTSPSNASAVGRDSGHRRTRAGAATAARRCPAVERTNPFDATPTHSSPRATLSPADADNMAAVAAAAALLTSAQSRSPASTPRYPSPPSAFPAAPFLGGYCIPIVPYGAPPPANACAMNGMPWWWSASHSAPAGAARGPTVEQGTQTRGADGAPAAEPETDKMTLTSKTDRLGKTDRLDKTGTSDALTRTEPTGPFDPLLASDATSALSASPQAAADAGVDGAATEEEEGPVSVHDLLGGAQSPAVAEEATAQPASITDGGPALIQHLSAAEERRFLLSLVSRVEGVENELTEKLEHHYQQTNEQMLALKRDLLIRLSGLSEDQKAALARLQMQQETTAEAIEDALIAKHQTPEQDVMDSLVDLIQTGIQRISAQMTAPEAEEVENSAAGQRAVLSSTGLAAGMPTSIFNFRDTATSASTRFGAPTAEPTPAPATEKDFLKEVNGRLKQLGW